MNTVIEIDKIKKFFFPGKKVRDILFSSKIPPERKIIAVDDVSLDIKKGELFGLLGPNGAGKTTLVKILSTLLLPDSGTARVNGFELKDEEKVKASIGLVSGEERSFYWRLTGRQNLKFFSALYNMTAGDFDERVSTIKRVLGMEEFIDRRFDTYSSGMKQRLAIARGMLNNPEILFLDEPTRSLDPTAARHLRETIHALVKTEGRTVILVTHRLEEASELCDRIAIMHHGKVRVVDSIDAIRKRIMPEKSYAFSVKTVPDDFERELACLPGVIKIKISAEDKGGCVLTVTLSDYTSSLPYVTDAFFRKAIQITDIETKELSLEDIFQKYTE